MDVNTKNKNRKRGIRYCYRITGHEDGNTHISLKTSKAFSWTLFTRLDMQITWARVTYRIALSWSGN